MREVLHATGEFIAISVFIAALVMLAALNTVQVV